MLGARAGDTIPYVICKGEANMIANRAFHIDEYNKSDSKLELGKFIIYIDIDWYLHNQIHPPVARLCVPIYGTDNARLAECLGI